MTPEEINIAIAEHLGWKFQGDSEFDALIEKRKISIPKALALPPGEGRAGKWIFDPFVTYWDVPNYATDLNAIHKAEKVLDGSQFDLFEYHLLDIVVEQLPLDGSLGILIPVGRTREISATAAQRAEAFLRTVGKWEEVQS